MKGASSQVVAVLCLAGVCYLPVAHGNESAADAPAEAEVILPDCPAVALERKTLFAALALELGHDGIRRIHAVAARRADRVTTIEVVLNCHPGTEQVRLRVHHASHQEAERAMAINDLPRRLRARAVALAAAELARSTWSRSPRSDDGDAAAPGDAHAGKADEPGDEAPPARKPPTRAAEVPAARPAPVPVTPAPPSPQKRWLSVAAGPAARWFMPAPSPTFGGRVSGRIGRWHLGTDILFGHDARFAPTTGLGLAVGWAGFDAVAWERGNFRFSSGLRLAAGAGWARTPVNNQEVPAGSPLPGFPDPQSKPPAQATRGWYAEGGLLAEVRARVPSVWWLALAMELGLGWGVAPGRDSLEPGFRSTFGASMLVGRDF